MSYDAQFANIYNRLDSQDEILHKLDAALSKVTDGQSELAQLVKGARMSALLLIAACGFLAWADSRGWITLFPSRSMIDTHQSATPPRP